MTYRFVLGMRVTCLADSCGILAADMQISIISAGDSMQDFNVMALIKLKGGVVT